MLSIDAARTAGYRDSLYFFRRNPLAIMGLAVCVVFMLVALFFIHRSFYGMRITS